MWNYVDLIKHTRKHPYYNLRYNPSAPFIRPPRIKFALVKFNSTDGSTWQFVHSAVVPMALF